MLALDVARIEAGLILIEADFDSVRDDPRFLAITGQTDTAGPSS